MDYRKIIPKIVVIAILTAFLGELKITPFESSFRFGLGSAGFFLLLLLYKDVPYRVTGLITGIFTTFFRTSLDFIFLESFHFQQSLETHAPIIGYYFTFAIILYLIKEKLNITNPIWLVLLGAFCDASSNFVELFIIYFFVAEDAFNSAKIISVFAVAIIRSVFVVGLFTIIQLNKLNAVYQEQQTRFEQVQTMLSELYIEVFYLKKTLTEIEDVTAKGHKLYGKLKESKVPNELSTLALTVVQEVHEVKKDNQRILAGLEKLIRHENMNISMSLSEIIHLSVNSNQKYVQFLNKNIHITTNQKSDFQVTTVYPLLVIMNNLVANGIEAIQQKIGFVKIDSYLKGQNLVIEVTDNGVGIVEHEQTFIFEPGYTTKFDEAGRASTGIGLSHVRSMVEELSGTIEVTSGYQFTSFIVQLPINKL